MNKTFRKELELWTFDTFSKFPGIDHFITTRHGGYSNDPFGKFNLSLKSGENQVLVAKNRTLLAEVLKTDKQFMHFPIQCHTGNVHEVLTTTVCSDLQETDALITNLPGQYLCVLVADCVPVIIYDPVVKTIAAIHAGWRGTVDGIVNNTILQMEKSYGCNLKNMLAAIGPSISAKNYEVGPEVIDKAKKYFNNVTGIVDAINNSGHGYLDLWEANRRQLVGAGVQPSNIEVSGICTYENNQTFYSARKESATSGRFACGICLNPY